jgi:hypothetical protein
VRCIGEKPIKSNPPGHFIGNGDIYHDEGGFEYYPKLPMGVIPIN